MTHKIAVINFIDSERTLLAKALSCASGYQLVQNRNIYEWTKQFRIDENQLYSWENQFLLMSSSFIKRIKSEFKFSTFISNGAAFTEVLSLKSKLNEKSIESYQPQEKTMLKSLLKITGRYAAQHYDLVIHVRNADSTNFDELSVKFYEKYHIPYKLYDKGDSLKDVFENIIREVEIPQALPAENAIYEAERLVNFKTWKS